MKSLIQIHSEKLTYGKKSPYSINSYSRIDYCRQAPEPGQADFNKGPIAAREKTVIGSLYLDCPIGPEDFCSFRYCM